MELGKWWANGGTWKDIRGKQNGVMPATRRVIWWRATGIFITFVTKYDYGTCYVHSRNRSGNTYNLGENQENPCQEKEISERRTLRMA
jgi:hypothetical protein